MNLKNKWLAWGALCCSLSVSTTVHAHDTWVQTNTNMVRVGDNVHIDLMLGNHGNEHRDFKLANKLDITDSTLSVVAPGGARYDLKSRLKDLGYTPEEGFWTAKMAPSKPGLYTVVHTSDKVMNYAPERLIVSAKTFFLVSKSLDRPAMNNPGFNRSMGLPLELVPQNSPVTPMGPGQAFNVRLLYKGKPLAGERVSFIPRGTVLKPGWDARYERKTNAKGDVTLTPTEANYYLIVAHHTDSKAGGKGYTFTKYSSTLTLFVPQICGCCGG